MKSKILSLAVIAGIFSGCAELPTLSLPTLPKKEINTELIKDIKTDGKGGYYVMSEEDCKKLKQAGLIDNYRYTNAHEGTNYGRCLGYVNDNIINDASKLSLRAYNPNNYADF